MILPNWDAKQYLKFEDERTRPARDLLAQIPLDAARQVYDLGCGPGNSTELLIARFPRAQIVGIDSSPEMLAKARQTLPRTRFIEADLSQWSPDEPAEVMFANAVFQWLPDHPSILRRLLDSLMQGGVLAVQMPDNLTEPTHALMQLVAETGPWSTKFAAADPARGSLPAPSVYYDLLSPLCRSLDIWHTIYNHVLDGPQGIVEWVTGTALRPYLAPLDAGEREAYLAAYLRRIAETYKPQADGKVLLRFPRLFIVAVRA
jgi:trans-aconitate 2-methyltransferase